MPTISGPWPFDVPDTSRPVDALELLFSTMAGSIRDVLRDAHVGSLVTSITDRAAKYPSPSQGDTVFRVDAGYFETYYATYNATTNPLGAASAGWYPAEQPGWVEQSLASGWATNPVVNATSNNVRFGRKGKTLIIQPGEYQRSGSTLSIGAGASITVATLPAPFRPIGIRHLGPGSIGVNGTLGASRWYLDAAGNLFFQSLVATGTMAGGGAVGNHVAHGELRLVLP